MKTSTMTNRMDVIIRQIIRNRFDAIIHGNSSEEISRLLSLTRDMGYNDLVDELSTTLKSGQVLVSHHL